MRWISILVACGTALIALPAGAAEQIAIPAGDLQLRATLYRPASAGPFPAVVALHTCDGLADASGPIAPRYQDWGEALLAAGFAVVFPDSFGSRGLASQCRMRDRPVRASRGRIADANAARHWLQAQPWAIGDRVSLLGWSHGATTALWTVRPRRAAPRDAGPDFRSAIAFYPNCRRLGVTAWSARIPTLILIGKADDWTPASACEQMVAGARGRSARASIVTYAGAYHDFDRANFAFEERVGLANTPNAAGRVHVGPNPAARADAFKRVPEWLAR